MPSPTKNQAADAVTTLLEHVLGEHAAAKLASDGMLRTPQRVVKALKEWTKGYEDDPRAILSTSFSDASDYDGFVALRDYDFVSTCEHHLARIIGKADVLYLPGEAGKVVGLSKLGRLVDCFANRFQVQERLTQEIVDALISELNPLGVAVRIRAEHQCMSTRGVHRPGCWTETRQLLGKCRTDPAVHQEVGQILAAVPPK